MACLRKTSDFIAAMLGVVALFMVSGSPAKLALRFGPPEYFVLILVSLVSFWVLRRIPPQGDAGGVLWRADKRTLFPGPSF